jgi:hypothetical protein
MSRLFKNIFGLLLRLGVNVFAFWWIFRSVNLGSLGQILRSADPRWMAAGVLLFSISVLGCITRWSLLAPRHPSLTWPFLADSLLVGQFFNTFLPTTVGGDVIRGYDLIKATGEWKGALASILADRLVGFLGFLAFALGAWTVFPPAREDPLVRTAFAGFCGLVVVTFAVLGSRRVLKGMLTPFGKIGLGQLQSHAAQFQQELRAYLTRPKQLAAAFGVTAVIQVGAILMYAAICRALHLAVPLAYLVLIVPIIITLAQVPVSLNGWGIREGVTVLFLGRIGISTEQALSLSLVCALIPFLSALVGAGLFLLRQRRKPKKP